MSKTNKKFKSVFLSDIHIGTRGANLIALSLFLKNIETDNLFLVGDILDLWMGKNLNLSPDALNLIRKFIKKAQQGTKVYYIPGNHDELFRYIDGYHSNNIIISNRVEYLSLSGKKILIIHGDMFDSIILNCKWLSHLGARAYDFIVYVNFYYKKICHAIGVEQKSFAAYIRTKVKKVASFISGFEKVLVKEAKMNGFDAVISGHIHSPCIKDLDGIMYGNCGDWLEHCSMIVENLDGSFQIITLPSD